MRTLLLVFLLFSHFSYAQSEDKLFAKANAVFLPIGMLNAGFEYRLSSKCTAQADIFISPWKSFAGNHSQVYMGHLEGRYYFQEAFRHWYVGANIGTAFFDIQKFNYVGTGKYQRGLNFMLGGVAGYQFQWKEKWNIDFFLGGGFIQSFYHGYENGVRYEDATWNKSGEILPYRGGIMIGYKLK